MLIHWSYLHASETKLHKARTQLSLHRICKRQEYAKAISSHCEKEKWQSSLGGCKLLKPTWTNVWGRGWIQHPQRMPSALGQDTDCTIECSSSNLREPIHIY